MLEEVVEISVAVSLGVIVMVIGTAIGASALRPAPR